MKINYSTVRQAFVNRPILIPPIQNGERENDIMISQDNTYSGTSLIRTQLGQIEVS